MRRGLSPAEHAAVQIGVETSRAVENKRIFIIESDEVTRAALQFILHDENEAHEISSLEEAWTRQDGRTIDLVLLGQALVEQHGIGVFSEISARFPGTKILLVTRSARDELAQQSLKSGAHGVLARPFTVESVRHRVDTVLGRVTQTVSVPLTVVTQK